MGIIAPPGFCLSARSMRDLFLHRVSLRLLAEILCSQILRGFYEGIYVFAALTEVSILQGLIGAGIG
jgi:hypothetical protein